MLKITRRLYETIVIDTGKEKVKDKEEVATSRINEIIEIDTGTDAISIVSAQVKVKDKEEVGTSVYIGKTTDGVEIINSSECIHINTSTKGIKVFPISKQTNTPFVLWQIDLE